MENNCDKMDSMDFGFQNSVILNEKANSIYFNGNITPSTMSTLIQKLLELERSILKKQKKLKRKFDDFQKEKNDCSEAENLLEVTIKPKPIMLYITSNGGYVYQVFTAIDTIHNMKVPVHTVCKGFVASAGTLLSLAGKKRYITENSYMLIHELRTASWGKFTQIAESFENSKQLMEHIKQYYVKHTIMTYEELDEQLKKDICWDAEMCIKKGLADEIFTA